MLRHSRKPTLWAGRKQRGAPECPIQTAGSPLHQRNAHQHFHRQKTDSHSSIYAQSVFRNAIRSVFSRAVNPMPNRVS